MTVGPVLARSWENARVTDEQRSPRLAARVASWAGLTLLTLVVIALVVVAVLPRVSGWHFVMVAGGSMEPTIPFGSVAVMYRLDDARGLEPGTIIEYTSPDTGAVTTHRIIDVTPDGNAYVTRGDANNAEDQTPVPIENVIGEYRYHIPELAKAIEWLQTPTGLLALVWIPGMLLILMELRVLVRGWRQRRAPAREVITSEPAPEADEPVWFPLSPGRDRSPRE